jgi:hypothetical protein
MEMLDCLRSPGRPLSILDVGGYKGRTADFLSADTVTVLDLFDISEENYVKGSALAMPFNDASFDYVLSFDVLEHIPQDKREQFFTECNRVAIHGFMICAPHKTAANQAAEQSLNELYTLLHGKPHRWLAEHIEYGIPDFDMFIAQEKEAKLNCIEFYSNKVQLWMAMQQAIFLNSAYPIASEALITTNTFYNKYFKYDGGGSKDSSYRIILCCLREKAHRDVLAKNLGNLNLPIDPLLEIKLYDVLHAYNQTLSKKLHAETVDYKALYEHTLSRAEQLQANGEELWSKINYLDAENVRLHNKTLSSHALRHLATKAKGKASKIRKHNAE